MAERRMFSKSVIDSDPFLDMPAEAQLLYFHLSMRADDDGFITPKKVMRLIGAHDDAMKILIAKRFVIPFESGVVVIRHWKVNNLIKNDRYHETEYKAEKSQLTLNGSIYEFNRLSKAFTDKELAGVGPKWNTDGSKMEHNWKHSGTQMEPQVRLGKDSIGYIEESISSLHSDISSSSCKEEEDIPVPSSKKEQSDPVDYQGIQNSFNSICRSFSKCSLMTDKRKNKLRTLLKTFSREQLEEVFRKAETSDFLSGRGKDGWHNCSFDWLIETSNMVKVLEGNYDNKDKKGEDTFELV